MLARTAAAVPLALALAAALAGCHVAGDLDGEGRAKTAIVERTTAYRVVWAQGRGRVGYLETREMSRGPDSPVARHVAKDLEFVEVGWVTDAGEGVRYEYPPTSLKSAYRAEFIPEPLPADSLDNQLRRLFGLDPATPISVVRATEADLRR